MFGLSLEFKWLLVILVVLFNSFHYCEMSIYPGLRRKPVQQLQQISTSSQQQQQEQPMQEQFENDYELNRNFLNQLMEENARRRLQLQFEQQLALINMQINRQQQQRQQQQKLLHEAVERERERKRERYQEEAFIKGHNYNYNNNNNDDDDDDDKLKKLQKIYNNDVNNYYIKPELKIPKIDKDKTNDRIEFAVRPSDYRFYNTNDNENDDNNYGDNDDIRNRSYKTNELLNGKIIYKEEKSEEIDGHILDDYEEYFPTHRKEHTNLIKIHNNNNNKSTKDIIKQQQQSLSSNKFINYHRIKPQTIPSKNLNSSMSTHEDHYNHYHNHRNDNKHNEHKQEEEEPLHEKYKQNSMDKINNEHENDHQLIVKEPFNFNDHENEYFLVLVAGISAVIIIIVVILILVCYNFRRRNKATIDVDYSAYAKMKIGPKCKRKTRSNGDSKLAQNAQMFHYQHQKQQIMAMENTSIGDEAYEVNYLDSDDDNEEGDYTVYECPGLAPTGEMEVKNPLFLAETPVVPSMDLQDIAHITNQQPLSKTTTINNNNNNKSDKYHNK